MIDCNFDIVAGQDLWSLLHHYMDWLQSGVVEEEEEEEEGVER
jgi:hypothetical protein